jgi:hypothetical protein
MVPSPDTEVPKGVSRYRLAMLLPPIAVLMSGKPFQVRDLALELNPMAIHVIADHVWRQLWRPAYAAYAGRPRRAA